MQEKNGKKVLLPRPLSPIYATMSFPPTPSTILIYLYPMKISWNWLQEILPVKMSADKAAELLTDIGLEVEGVYAFESVKGGLEGLVAGEVITCEKHPDADKLKVTTVNTGSGEILQIVCGAPNVAAGQKVIVAVTGTTIHPIKGESFTIKKAKIRGVESNGMLCAEDEIGLGEGHDGLFILPSDTVVGTDIKKLFNIYSDTIIEIGLTANHADANSHFGTARELRAALISRGIEFPELKDPTKIAEVLLENEKGCFRYSGILLENITIKESSAWLQNKLKAVGMRPINNAVDITNYILQEFGQPLHAFDADKITGNTVIIKTLPQNTEFITLDEKTRKLNADDLMICNAAEGMCIAGVYGGIHSGITSSTKNIFIESACFNPSFIRRTENNQGLKTDASSRYAKGTDVEITMKALQTAASMLVELCGGEIQGSYIDIYPNKINATEIFLRYARLEMMSTIKIPQETIITILESLNIKIAEKTPEGLKLEVPSYKNDVLREIDIIEEILRMYGFNNIPVPAGIRTPYLVSPKPDKEKIRQRTINYLTDSGCYEIFTNAISRSKYVEKFIPEINSERVNLLNSLNAELDCMRQTMLFTGLEVISYNHNHKQQDLKMFEFGRVYSLLNGKYTEAEKIGIYFTGSATEENWRNTTRRSDHFDIKQLTESLLSEMNCSATWNNIPPTNKILESGAELIVGGKNIGICGAVKKEICADFDIKIPVYYAELDWNMLLENLVSRKVTFKEISKFPEVRRDLALILEPSVTFAEIETITKKEGKPILKDIRLFDVYEGEKLEGKKSYAVGLTFGNPDRTLTDSEVEDVIQKLLSRYEKELNAVIRK